MSENQQDGKNPCGELNTDDLIQTLRRYLLAHSAPISEYDLLQGVREHAAFSHINAQGQLALFQQHFILMHALYRLRESLRPMTTDVQPKTPWEPMALHISALAIYIQPLAPNTEQTAPSFENDAGVASYYLDWENYFATGAEQVGELIGEFWRAYDRYFNRDEALAILNLESNADSESIAKRFRELAAKHHPDRGGDKETFIKIRAAYESLRN